MYEIQIAFGRDIFFLFFFSFLWNFRCYSCIGNGRKEGFLKSKRNGESNNKNNNVARSFAFKELAIATQSFRETNLIGEGGFGSVYKGRIDSGQASFFAFEILMV